MSGIGNKSGSANSRRKRVIKVSPMTRAVRMAMAASLAALALGASGGAFAAGCKSSATELMPCTSAVVDATPVLDLTLVRATASAQFTMPVTMPLAISESDVGDVVIDNADPISEYNVNSDSTAIYGYSSAGSVDITNQATGELYAYSVNYSATGIEGYAQGDVSIDNAGEIDAGSYFGNAIGIYGYSVAGNVSIDNSADITVSSEYGLADGVFASGADVDVTNSGSLDVYGYTWAAGIEAQGSDSTTVTNEGDINVEAPGFLQVYAYGYGVVYESGGTNAYGIYATGGEGGVQVSNSGNIAVDAGYATGIEVQSYGDVSVDNSGGITAGSGLGGYAAYNPYNYIYYYISTGTGTATGINASSSGTGAVVSIDNSGDIGAYGIFETAGINANSSGEGGSVQVDNGGSITAAGYFGAYGVSATATGTGGSASVTNSGSIYAYQGTQSGSGAYGIFASADGDASIDNTADASIYVYSPGAATGAAALSFAGDASVTNAGDISVASTAFDGDSAYGIVSFAQNGNANVDNSGNVDVTTVYIGVGIDAGGLEGATVDSSGDIAVDGYRAFGIRANSGAGDVSVTNEGSIYASYSSFYGYAGRAYGIFATSTQGDVSVDNGGDIYTTVAGQSVGVFAVSDNGDVDVSNSGTITAYSYSSIAAGIYASAGYGTTSVFNTGSIDAYSYNANAFGVLAVGESVEVSNNGDISANGLANASGIVASAYYDSTVTNAGGSIDVIAIGQANGIDAQSLQGGVVVENASDIDAAGIVLGATGINGYAYGNVDIDNSGDVYAGSLYGNAIGIYGYSIAGDVSISNSGAIEAISYYGLADGIFASGANVEVANSGSIETYGYTWTAGIEAQGADSTMVSNSGDITASTQGFNLTTYSAYAYYSDGEYYSYATGEGVLAYAAGGTAFGIYATGGEGGVALQNSGNISVEGGYTTGIEVQSGGDITVTNSGDIASGSFGTDTYTYVYSSEPGVYPYNFVSIDYNYLYGTQVATGINATSNGEGAAIQVTNSGDISAEGIYGATGIAATATGTGGTAVISNSGSIYASQYNKYGYGAYGIVSSADGDASVNNSATGDITVYSNGAASGATALSFAGDASVTNAGDIHVENTALKYYNASGIVSFAQNGEAIASNSGSVSAVSSNVARAVDAAGFSGATVVNSGSLYANGKYAYGVYASSGTGDVSVTNTTTGSIEAYSYGSSAFGVLGIATQGDVIVGNAGSIEVYGYGQSVGVFGVALEGDTSVTSSGDITVISGGDVAVGVFARADYGTASINNSGDILASDDGVNGFYGYAAYGVLTRGTYAAVTNSGSVVADGNYYATGIAARSDYGTTVTNSATGDIYAYALLVAIGVEGRAEYGDVSVANAGNIGANGVYGGAVGVQAYSYLGDVSVANSGHVVAESEYGTSIGVTGYSVLGNVAVSNSNTIDATGYYGGYGIVVGSALGDVSVSNSGAVTATSPDTARGILATAYGNVTINNSGDVVAIAGGDAADVAAVEIGSLDGTATLNNSGTLSVDAALDDQIAVLGSDGVEFINNTGDIYGSLVLLGGNDRLNNNSGGVWHVDNQSSDFGDGDDSIVNNAGGLIAMHDGAIHMGAGSDSILNQGLISIDGDNLIDLGGSSTDLLTNSNRISFMDGDTDDVLTIVGNFGGTGSLGLDVDLASPSSDQLYVEGSMTANAAQRVDIQFDGMPLMAHTSIDFAHVSGTSVAGNFVPGQILSYNYPRNFIDLQYSIGSRLNTANTADDVFSIDLDVFGLLDSGTLAANVASGAAGMLNAQIGTLRQRLGVNPYGDDGKVMSAFYRYYSSEGDVSPDAVAANFGQGGNFAYSLDTWGQEVGVNANLFGNFHAGVTLGTADGRQRLTGAGIGQNRMDGMTWGVYATWFAPQGFYVDVSGRWMAVDVESTSAAGLLQTRAHTKGYNLEAGYKWQLGNGLEITPQLQYTHAEVEDVRTVHGDRANFESEGGDFSRARVGVEVSKTFNSGNLRWTPYGSINAIRQLDGKANYTVADNFFGSTSVEGTSAMAEVGLGVQSGGWGFNLGVNWTDGGAYKSFVGGQAIVRFAW